MREQRPTMTKIYPSALREIDKLVFECQRIEQRRLTRAQMLNRMVHEDIKRLILQDSEIKRRKQQNG